MESFIYSTLKTFDIGSLENVVDFEFTISSQYFYLFIMQA